MSKFPKNFVWGAASSAYQIEGDPLADGGGKSVWDTFSHTPGKTFEGNTGDTACRSYAHPEWDIENLKHMGLSAYRFSTSWARIDPEGDGNWNEKGLAYYDRLVDLCLEAGIAPYMTLYHWELPQALEDRDGWLNPETPKAFARFAGMMAGHFRGRVKHYFLLNEPQCVAALGYGNGIHAPGRQEPMDKVFLVWKHLLLAYGLAAQAIRAVDGGAGIGIATTGRLCYPETEADIAAAEKATFQVFDNDWLFTHQMALDPICFGAFPKDCAPGQLRDLMATVTPEELEIYAEKWYRRRERMDMDTILAESSFSDRKEQARYEAAFAESPYPMLVFTPYPTESYVQLAAFAENAERYKGDFPECARDCAKNDYPGAIPFDMLQTFLTRTVQPPKTEK